MGQGSFARGQLLGNVLIGVIVAVIGVLLALLSAGATLEFTAVGILRLLKQAGKLGVETARTALRENVAAARSIGRSVRHGFPHAVSGASDLLRGRKPFDWESQLSHLHQSVGKAVSGHILGQVEEARGAIQVGRELHSRVSQHLKGKRGFSREDEVGRYIGGQTGNRGTGNSGGLPVADIRALAEDLGVGNYQHSATIAEAEKYAQNLGVSQVTYGGEENLQAANVTNLALQRIVNANRDNPNLPALRLPNEVVVDRNYIAKAGPTKGRRFFVDNPGAVGASELNIAILNPDADYFRSPAVISSQEFSIREWSTSDPSHAVFHEFGHVAHFEAALRDVKNDAPLLEHDIQVLQANQILTRYSLKGEKGFKDQAVSQYWTEKNISNRAGKNLAELVAEAYANRVSYRVSGKQFLPNTTAAVTFLRMELPLPAFYNGSILRAIGGDAATLTTPRQTHNAQDNSSIIARANGGFPPHSVVD